ncbi:MAG: deoxyribodipyrimidine photo-lyase [Phycisphaerales bacterium]|nr:deoxyribodipyrimidine photo-lyase [Phycisphaerales bacterium]
MRALMWFRGDLRVRDNPALDAACRAASKDANGGVVAAFTICPKQWQAHDWADVRVGFMMRTLAELQDALAERNIPLRIVTTPTFAEAPKALGWLAQEVRAGALYFNDEYEINEQRRDEQVQAAFEKAGRAVHRFTDQVVFRPGEVLTKDERFYTVFTPFKKAWINHWREGEPPEVLGLPKKQPEIDVASDEIPQHVSGIDFTNDLAERWPAGEKEAAKRLDRFVEGRLADYKDARDLYPMDGTSTLSPYLAAGAISPRQCFWGALEANNNRLDSGSKGAATWISELIWREFYRNILVGFPRVSMHQPFRTETRSIPWRDDEEELAAWKEGRTGYPVVDAAMRCLSATGWMHNRLRMIVAMFLSKHLLLDWRLGEKHFMRSLVDGDLANNNGGWQWSASTGTDAAPYFRVFNPFLQSKRYDPKGEFIRAWVPELAGVEDGNAIHNPQEHAGGGLFARLDYPEPIVDHAKARDRVMEAWGVMK